MSDQKRLVELIRAGHTCVRVVTHEEDYVVQLVRNAALSCGRTLWLWSCGSGAQDGLLSGSACIPKTDDAIGALNHFLACTETRPICVMLDLCPHLNQPRILRCLRNFLARAPRVGVQLVLIDAEDTAPAVIDAHAARFDISYPDEAEIERLVRDTLRDVHADAPIEIDITRRGHQAIIRNLLGLSRRQVEQVIRDVVVDRRLNLEDLDNVIERKRALLSRAGLLEYVRAPTSLDEIGGLAQLKSWLARRAHAFSEQPPRFGLAPPRGVLMLGVQGAGKSLCAKAIATAWSRPLMRMDVGALYDRYVGESERRLRDALAQSERMAPVVLWIDEIEKAFASAASQSTDGGLSKRMFGSLLTWMQEHASAVFLVATANDIEALPPELLRKGRFDEIFFVDLPGERTRREIFRIHLAKRGQDPAAFDVERLTEESAGYSGAEIEQSIVAALYESCDRGAALDTAMVSRALANSPPLSVTMAERVDALRAWARGRCVPAE